MVDLSTRQGHQMRYIYGTRTAFICDRDKGLLRKSQQTNRISVPLRPSDLEEPYLDVTPAPADGHPWS